MTIFDFFNIIIVSKSNGQYDIGAILNNTDLNTPTDGGFCIDDSSCKRHGTTVDAFFVNGTVFTDGKFIKTSLLLKDRKTYFTDDVPPETKVVDCTGQYILPGFADMHVHLREPGFEYKETIATGTAAGLAGGYTLLCSMPNLKPVPHGESEIKKQLEIIEKKARCKVLPYASITVDQKGLVLSDMETLAPYCIGFSDDGHGVQDYEMMRKAMEIATRLNKPIVSHCEVGNPGASGVVHAGQYAKRNDLPSISSASEYEMVDRDIRLAATTGAHLHICHVSTAESVRLIRAAKASGVHVTAETAPHYLLLTDEDIKDEGRFKMNPPIRSEFDREELLLGIKDGTIDIIATDHAPHSVEEKSGGLLKSSFGIVGLETAFSVLYTGLVATDIITLTELVNLMAIRPREIFGIKAGIADGNMADFCVIETDTKFIIDSDNFLSKGSATPFDGDEVYGRVLYTRCAMRRDV